MSSKLDKLKIALEKNELYVFLTGKKIDYNFVCPYADMPTDPSQTFDAIKEYYLEGGDSDIWNKFESTINEMSKQSEDAWLNVYYLSTYLSFRNYKKVDFIDLDKTINNIVAGLLKFKNELSQNKNWGGNQFNRGLWDDAIRLINILNSKYKLNIKID